MLFALALAFGTARPATIKFAKDNWGSIASIWSLGVSIYVLFIAKGARTAAREARLRTALEELEDAAEKCRQVRQFAQDGKWPLVNLRAMEVMALCTSTLARWENDEAFKNSRNKLLQVATLMRSIVVETDNSTPNRAAILGAQLDSDNKLAVVVGRMHGKQASGGN